MEDCRFCEILDIQRDIYTQEIGYKKYLNIVIEATGSNVTLDDFENVFLCDSNKTLTDHEKRYLREMKNYIDQEKERMETIKSSFQK